MKHRSKFISTILVGTCLFTLVSCGNDDDSSSSRREEQQQQHDQGIYRAILRPLNVAVAGNTSGTIEIKIEGDDVVVQSHIAGSPRGVKHFQNIMTLSACPTEASDKNNDTFIDIAESLPSSGPILIPLDSDLSEQLDGMDYGPISNGAGAYTYKRSTTLTNLLADLRAPDPDPVDSLVKLPADQNLNLTRRVIIVHGVAPSENLPDSLATLGDMASDSTLPIACGELVRVLSEDTTTGEIEDDSTIGEDENGMTNGALI